PRVGRINERRADQQRDGPWERFRVAAHDEDGHPRRGHESERGVTMSQPGCDLTHDHHSSNGRRSESDDKLAVYTFSTKGQKIKESKDRKGRRYFSRLSLFYPSFFFTFV